MEDFYSAFKQEEVSINETINSIANGSFTEEKKQAAIGSTLRSISQLSNEVTDAAGRLPVHHLQNYSKAIESMTKRLQEVRTASAPNRKFFFKKSGSSTPIAHLRPSESSPAVRRAVTTEKQTDTLSESPNERVSQQHLLPLLTPNTGFRLSSLNATHYVLATPAYGEASMASLEDIQGSFIDLSILKSEKMSFATLMVNNVKESLVICGTVTGSAHITAVIDSTIVITARQIRIHDCENIVVYLQCSSRPIIEDCTGVRFAPLPNIFETEHGKAQSNLWDQVDDFKWIKPESSPNWSVLKPEDDRAINDESWREICGQNFSIYGVKALLKYAKIQH